VPDDAVIVGTISRLDEPKKGLGVFLRAARGVVDLCPKICFVICGDGYARGQLQALAQELGIGDRVHFLGYWENALEVYRLLDVFVLPSLSEGFPTVNLEAMAAGLAVVTTDVGGAAEAVLDGETGFVVSPQDEVALRDAIVRLCEDASLRREIGHRAQTFVNEMFTVETLVWRIIEVYEETGMMRA
jgi:glycosyltransferase involved in cell wall biosynthesis